jgi:MFS family permease
VETVPPSRYAVFRTAARNGRLRRALAAYLVFNLVEWATWIAILVWAYEIGGVQGASLIAVVQLLPAALLAPVIAVALARLPHGTALAVGYGSQAVTFLACGAALVADMAYPVVAVLAALAAVSVSMTRPVHFAVVPDLSETTAELTTGNAASGWVEAAAMFAGPLLSGLLIVPWGAGGVVLAMGAASVVALLLTVGLRVSRKFSVGRVGVGERVRQVGADPVARVLSLLVGAEYVLVGMLDILLVLLAIDLLAMGESGPGLLNAMLGVGGMVGAVAALALVGRQRLAPALVLGGITTGGAIAVAGLSTTPLVAMALIAASGIGKVFVDVGVRTQVARVLPDRLLTAVFGLQEATIMGGLALGALLAPLVVALAGNRGAFVVAGLVLPVLLVVMLGPLRRTDSLAQVPIDVLELLSGVPALSLLPARLLDRLALDSEPVTVPAGRSVVVEGEVGDRFYVIAEGEARVDIGGSVVRQLGPGAWFGELALLRDVPRTATVTAVTDLRLHGIRREPFLAVVAGIPSSVDAVDDYARRTYRLSP